MKILKLIKPTSLTLGFFILLGLLASIIPYGITATSKGIWEEFHGLPWKFMQFSVCYGRCNPRRYLLEEFDLVMFMVDILIWYVIACLVVPMLSTTIHNQKIKAIVP